MNKTITAIVIVIIVAVGSFYAGMKYGQDKNSSANLAGKFQFGQDQKNGNFPGGAGGRIGRGINGGSAINGQILSMDDKSITVKDRTGGSKIVFYSGTTSVGKFVSGVSSDLTVGVNIMATGTTNADGSVTANSIQIRPDMPAGRPDGNNPGNSNTPPTNQ